MNKAVLLKPEYKDYLWGGKRLAAEYGKDASINPLAESWETAKTEEMLGVKLPILVKFIDAAKDLSVQVHPSDEDVEGFGKTEMWYILDAAPGACIYYGLRRSMTEDQVRAAIDKGTLTRYLNKVHVKPNEVYFIPAGLIHAIGAGVLVAEVQENSDYTYRLYDYNRVDKQGNKRDLHIDKALSVASLSAAPEPRQPMRVLNYRPGLAKEFLCRCKYFIVERAILNCSIEDGSFSPILWSAPDESFNVLLCIEGAGTFDGNTFKKGDCIFVPAGVNVELTGKATFVCVSC